MSGQTFSASELAVLLGVHRNTLSKWLAQGCPYVTKADRQHGVEWELSLPDVVQWREKKAMEAAVGDSSTVGIDEAKRRKVTAEAAIAELNLMRLRDSLVAVDDVAAIVQKEYANTRARLLSISGKAAPLLLELNSIAEIKRIIDEVIDEALQELTADERTPADYAGRGGGSAGPGAAPDGDTDGDA